MHAALDSCFQFQVPSLRTRTCYIMMYTNRILKRHEIECQGQDCKVRPNHCGSFLQNSSLVLSITAPNPERQESQTRIETPARSSLDCISSASMMANKGSELRWYTTPFTSLKISKAMASNAAWQCRLRSGSESVLYMQLAAGSLFSRSLRIKLERKRAAYSFPLRRLVRSSSER